ncbi:MAG: T9SS type A sorting domain-containing protein, partial [Flavisolibacter sp.]|nr:T9SS type A sorting domain-containing protein [Flavisolibacter sp.]
LIRNNNISGIVPIGILDYRFHTIDPAAQNKLLRYKDGRLYDMPGRLKSPYLQHRIQLTALLAKAVQAGTIRLKFLPQLYKTNHASIIRSITITGLTPTAIDVPLDGSTVNVTIGGIGKKVMHIRVVYANGEEFSNTSTLQIENSINTVVRTQAPVQPGASYWISSTIPFKGYDESVAYHGKNKVSIYSRGSGNTLKPIMKPIIVVDGFDPSDVRDAQKIYQEEFQYINEKNQSANFADEIRADGFDLVIVDHPAYNKDIRTINDPTNTLAYPPDWINGGGDYIQRNAMVLIALIQKVNAELKANGSNEQIIVVGPSMGGEITRYALRYMELHKMTHNCKLWVSFDSPHQGAHVPLGLQYLVEGFSNVSDAAKTSLDVQINCPAAKQMLVHHYLSGQELPAGAPNFKDRYYQEVDNLGWPEQCRKIAMISGSDKGLPVQPGAPSMKAIAVELKLRKVTRLLLGLLGLADPVILKGNVYLAPDQQQGRGKVFEGRIILNNLSDRYARAPSYARQSIDLIPSGYYPGFQEIKESSDQGWYSSFLNIPLEQNFNALLRAHAHEPVYSTLALGKGPHPNPNRKWDDDLSNSNVTCGAEKESPFDAYWGPDVNTRHDSLLYGHVVRLRDELKGIPMQQKIITQTITGDVTGYMCIGSKRNFQVANPKPGQQYVWNTSSSSLAIVSGQGTPNVTIEYTGGALSSGQFISVQATHPCYTIAVNSLPFAKDFAFQPAICSGRTLYSIAPNPANNNLYITAANGPNTSTLLSEKAAGDANIAISTIRIFDASGNIYYQQRYSNVKDVILDVSGFKPGMYLIEISNGRNVERQKLMILK